MMRKIWIAPLGIIASLVALTLIINGAPQLVDVFELADPTGSFGAHLALGGLAANLAVIFITITILLVRGGAGLWLGFALVAFIPPLLTALAAAPCFLAAHPGALWGVGAVLVGSAGIPVVLVAAIAFVATA